MNKKVLLLHGWAVNKYIFNNITNIITDFSIDSIDLPGHGTNKNSLEFNIYDIANNIGSTIKNKIHLLGWSLGGTIAMLIASIFPEKILSLSIISSFAKYSLSDVFSIGIKSKEINTLYNLLNEDYEKYIDYFIKIQSFNMHKKKQNYDLNSIINKVISTKKPQLLYESLQAILAIDIRKDLKKITTPTLIIAGKNDKITPLTFQRFLHENINNSELIIFNNSNHIPFLSESDLFIETVINFWKQNNNE